MRQEVRSSAKKRILFLPHAIKQMSRPDRMITADEIQVAVLEGEIIEAYLEDARGARCLVLHVANGRTIHVVCSPKFEYLAIITAYVPAPERWTPDFRARL